MFLFWNQNGKERVWDLSITGSTRKLRKALKKAVPLDSMAMERLQKAENISDLHHAIYYMVGRDDNFVSFEIKSEK